MAITGLNHINIRTMKMEETKDFFVDVVGLKIGARPPFAGHGYWLYCGDQPIVHLSLSEPDSPARTNPEGMGDGFDHIGLFAEGLDDVLANIEKHGVTYDKRLAAGGKIVQVFFNDPNGVIVEIGFDAAKEGVTQENFEAVPA